MLSVLNRKVGRRQALNGANTATFSPAQTASNESSNEGAHVYAPSVSGLLRLTRLADKVRQHRRVRLCICRQLFVEF